jgi:TolB-like protein/Tfp pilus assembly protein PilF
MSFVEELKRRNVVRVGVAYGVASWVLLQIADLVLENIAAPPWVIQALMLIVLLGFVASVVIAWAYEITPEGIKREADVDRSQSIAGNTGQKLDRIIIGFLVIAVVVLMFDRSFSTAPEPGIESASQFAASQAGTIEARQADVSQAVPGQSESPSIASSDHSIAVLPFANRSNNEDDLFFTDGIHDDLLTQLAKIGHLKVISRTSMMKYRNTVKTIPEIAAELGVSNILEGGIQRAGKRVRINAQLIDVNDDQHLWAETFDRELTMENIFDIQSEITRQIVTAIRGELSATESASLAHLPTSNLEAYESFLRAKIHLNDPYYSPEKYIQAEPWLHRAVELDPTFAEAWAQLVVVHGQAIWQSYDETPERYEVMRLALANAEKFGPGMPETLAARAEYLYRVETDFKGAESYLEQAIQAKPGDSELLLALAITERRTGRFEQAITHFQMAIDLDPDNLDARAHMLTTLNIMGEFDRVKPLAVMWAERYPDSPPFQLHIAVLQIVQEGDFSTARSIADNMAFSTNPLYIFVSSNSRFFDRDYPAAIRFWSRALDEPSLGVLMQMLALQGIGKAYRHMGDPEQAAEFSRRAVELAIDFQSPNKNNMAFMLDGLAQAYIGTGELDKALQASQRAMEMKPESEDSLEGPIMSTTHALILGMMGRRDESLAEVTRLLKTPGGPSRSELQYSPDWDFFRDDERFNALADPMKDDKI